MSLLLTSKAVDCGTLGVTFALLFHLGEHGLGLGLDKSHGFDLQDIRET